jgi:MFS transporter, DHA1 family, multidrug resistance protein
MGKSDLKLPVYSSLMLAFAGIGDAFLYPFLPLNYQTIGISAGSVGLLLSINRFVRLFTNHLMVNVFSALGFRKVSIAATLFAVITTISYGFIHHLILWIIARIVWGLCFSALRLSALSYSLESQRKGFSLGLNGSINEVGSIIGLIAGPVLLKFLNVPLTFLSLGFISGVGLYFAFQLPDLLKVKSQSRLVFCFFPDIFNLLILFSSFVIEGVLILVVSILLKEENIDMEVTGILALAGLYLNFRRICKVIFSPLAGWISDRIGFEKVFSFSLLLICFGMMILTFFSISVGLIVIFIFNGVNISVVPGSAAENAQDKLNAISETSTWRDLGAAIGTFVGGFLLSVDNLASLFWIPASVLLVLLYFYQSKAITLIKTTRSV